MSDAPATYTTAAGEEKVFPAIGTEKTIQLMNMASQVLPKLPNLNNLFEAATAEYQGEKARAYTTRAYVDGLDEETREAFLAELESEWKDQWTYLEDLEEAQREKLDTILGINAEVLAEKGIGWSVPSEDAVPLIAKLTKTLPDIWNAVSDELILAVALVFMDDGRVAKAVASNTLDQQLRDYRVSLTASMGPAEFISLAKQTVEYVVREMIEIGGDVGKAFADIKAQAATLVAEISPDEEDEPSTPSDSSPSSEQPSSISSPTTSTD